MHPNTWGKAWSVCVEAVSPDWREAWSVCMDAATLEVMDMSEMMRIATDLAWVESTLGRGVGLGVFKIRVTRDLRGSEMGPGGGEAIRSDVDRMVALGPFVDDWLKGRIGHGNRSGGRR